MNRLYIIYTGGTIGMRRAQAAGGYVPQPGIEARLRALFAAAPASDSAFSFTVHEYAQPIDSANGRPHHWPRIAADIIAHYDAYDGFIVLHGTDTMAYTAAALSFWLRGRTKPVVVTGSQIPLSEMRNDAQNNLITAMLLAGRRELSEVCLYFNGRLLRGNRATKVHADGFDAFDSPNYPWLGQVGINIDINRNALLTPASAPPPAPPPRPVDDAAVAVLTLYPGLPARLLTALLAAPLRGLVLRAYGVGNAPNDELEFSAALAAAAARGVVIVVLSQCLHGGVNLDSYATGQALAQTGAISGFDMTTEAALGKLHYLLAHDLTPAEIKARLQRDLCGELSADGYKPGTRARI